MAENRNDEILIKVGYEIQTDASQANADLDTFHKKIQDVAGADLGNQNVKSYKSLIREATAELQKVAIAQGENSKAFQEGARNLANLRERASDFNDMIEAFNPNNKFQALAKVAQGASTALVGVSGGMAALGFESENAAQTLQRLQGIMMFSDAISSIDAIKDGYSNFLSVLGLTTSATEAQSVATGTQAVATEGATVATRGLGLAFKMLGIGLLISAIAYLVTNWDSVTASIKKLLPAGAKVGNWFDSIKAGAMGVGNAIMQYIATPFKAITALLSGDLAGFKKAITDGFNFKKNYTDGYHKQELSNQENHHKELLTKQVAADERNLQRQKAQGKNVENAEIALQKKKLTLYEKGSKEYKDQLKVIEDLTDSHIKNVAVANKAAGEKAIAAQKSASDKAIAAKKVIDDKALADEKKLNEDKAKNVLAADEYLAQERIKHLSKYQAEKEKIEKDTKTLSGAIGVTPEQKAKIEAAGVARLAELKAQSEADANALNSDTDLKYSTIDNTPSEKDSPEVATAKIQRLTDAKMLAENTAFEAKKLQLTGQQEAIENLTAQHEANLTGIDKTSSEERKRIADAEKEHKQAVMGGYLDLATQFGGVLGQINSKNKALSIASVAVEQAAAIGKIIMNTGVANAKAVAASPLTAGQPFVGINTASAGLGIASAILAGRNAIKGITSGALSTGGSVGGGGGTTYAAPTINSTVLQQANAGTQDVRIVNQQEQNQQPIKAYIVSRDLDKYSNDKATTDRLSTI